MLTLIGNAPSSGSTFFADLMDSSPYTLCGPELGLFSNQRIYSFHDFKKTPFIWSRVSSGYVKKTGLNSKRLFAYGLNEQLFCELLENSLSLDDFVENFTERYAVIRGKEKARVLFEKTPLNINAIKHIVEGDFDGNFVHLVRNPCFVYLSLIKRNFDPYIASITWLLSVAKFIKYADSSRVTNIKYENLVKDPFGMASSVLRNVVGVNYSAEKIEKCYKSNKYRSFFAERIESWGVPNYGHVKNANKVSPLKSERIILKSMLEMYVNKQYAEKYDIAEISFVDALKYFGYYDEFQSVVCGDSVVSLVPKARLGGAKLLLGKYIEDVFCGDAKLSEIKTYLKPCEWRKLNS